MRVGIFGGSFDPPHRGHLEVARASKLQANLDKVVFVPAKKNPLKDKQPLTQNRLELLRNLIDKLEGFEIDLCEINRSSPSFTIETLEYFKTPQVELFLIMGADSAAKFKTWHRYEDIISIVSKILIYPRNGIHFDLLDKMELLKGEEIYISSTHLRSLD